MIWTPIRSAAWSPGTVRPPLPRFDASWKIILALSSAGDFQSLGSSLFKVLPLAEGFDWNFDEIRWQIVGRFDVDIIVQETRDKWGYQRRALVVGMRIWLLYCCITGMTRASVSIRHATLESMSKPLNEAMFNSPSWNNQVPRLTPKYFTCHLTSSFHSWAA